jgi:hypothetical protein
MLTRRRPEVRDLSLWDILFDTAPPGGAVRVIRPLFFAHPYTCNQPRARSHRMSLNSLCFSPPSLIYGAIRCAGRCQPFSLCRTAVALPSLFGYATRYRTSSAASKAVALLWAAVRHESPYSNAWSISSDHGCIGCMSVARIRLRLLPCVPILLRSFYSCHKFSPIHTDKFDGNGKW